MAYLTDTSITGNLLGDFVKGKDLSHLPQHWQQGIRLHRAIDVYTDNHPIVKQLRTELGPLRRYGGIIIDILFDHILAKQFTQHNHGETLACFAAKVYADFLQQPQPLPENFLPISQRMAAYDWLTSYQHADILKRVLERTSLRLSRQPPLHDAHAWYLQQQPYLDQLFAAFYADLVSMVNNYSLK